MQLMLQEELFFAICPSFYYIIKKIKLLEEKHFLVILFNHKKTTFLEGGKG